MRWYYYVLTDILELQLTDDKIHPFQAQINDSSHIRGIAQSSQEILEYVQHLQKTTCNLWLAFLITPLPSPRQLQTC